MATNLNKDAVYRAAKPKIKEYTISDGDGLYLSVTDKGAKLWRFVYSFQGNRAKLAFGAYPDTSLENARRKAEQARTQIANGIDPRNIKKQEKAELQAAKSNKDRLEQGLPIINSFADIANQWLDSIVHLTNSVTHIRKESRLKRLTFPLIGNKPISEIKSSDILETLKPLIAKRQLETAHRLHSEISAIFAYAIVHNIIDYDPATACSQANSGAKSKTSSGIDRPQTSGTTSA
jgi:hypothetical protein